MSKITLSFLFLVVGYTAFGQVGIGTNSPNPKSVLELSSPTNNQGFLVPRLTTAQRTSIAPNATEKGLLVFDTNTNKFHFWSGTAWVIIDDATGTDNQTLSFTAPNLIISGGNSVNLSGINTDGQTLNFLPATGLLSISGGNNVTIAGTLPGGAAGGDLTGTYPNPTINNNAVTTAKIADGSITNFDVNAAAGILVTKLASGTNGQILTTVGTTPTWSTIALGTLTSITAGTGLTGGTITSTGTIGLAPTAVAPGSYGSATQVANFTVDAQGRLTAAGNTIIAGVAPGGAAGGDLSGTYPNPTVTNNAITSAKIADATVVTADLADGSVNSAKVLDGSIANADINAAAGIVVTKLAAASTNGHVLTTSSGVPTWAAPNLTGTAGGDLTGTYPNPTVTNNAITSAKIADATIVAADLADGSVNAAKVLDGSIANADINTAAGIVVTKLAAASTNGHVLTTSSGVPTWAAPNLTGTAGGDLTGTYPNPTVTNNAITSAKIADATIATADLADGSVNSNKILDGTIANADINTAAGIVVTKLAAGTNGQVLTTTGGVPAWGTPTLTGTAGGDLTGTYPNPVVSNNAITSAKILDGTITGADILDGTIATVDVANGAIIDSKITNVAPTKILQGGAAVNQILKWNGTSWAPAADNTGSGVSGSGTNGSVTFWTGTSNVASDPNFTWDSKDGFLGVNTATPRGNLHVNGSQFSSVTVLPGSTSVYEIKPSDYILVAPPTSTAKPMDILLPLSSSNLGRILIIRTFGSSASLGARVSLFDSKDRLDLIAGNSYFLIFDNDSTTYSFCITVVATEVGWVTIGRDRNGATN